jgi:serine/threonine-protein kinase HipA
LALAELQRLADAVGENNDMPDGDAEEQVKSLLLLGTSMGGARPKAVVEDEGGLWLAKFGRPDDRWNNARVERAMLVLARQCGIVAAESRIETIGDRDVLLVRRFDRDKAPGGYRRARMVSGLTQHFGTRLTLGPLQWRDCRNSLLIGSVTTDTAARYVGGWEQSWTR